MSQERQQNTRNSHEAITVCQRLRILGVVGCEHKIVFLINVLILIDEVLKFDPRVFLKSQMKETLYEKTTLSYIRQWSKG